MKNLVILRRNWSCSILLKTCPTTRRWACLFCLYSSAVYSQRDLCQEEEEEEVVVELEKSSSPTQVPPVVEDASLVNFLTALCTVERPNLLQENNYLDAKALMEGSVVFQQRDSLFPDLSSVEDEVYLSDPYRSDLEDPFILLLLVVMLGPTSRILSNYSLSMLRRPP